MTAKRLTTIALPTAIALTVAGAFVDPGVDETSLTTYMQGLARDGAGDRYQVSAFILHLAFLAFIPAMFGLWALARPGIVRTAALVIGVYGAATLSGLVVTDYYDIALARSIPAAQGAHASDTAQHLLGAQLLVLPTKLALLAPLVLIASAVRHRRRAAALVTA